MAKKLLEVKIDNLVEDENQVRKSYKRDTIDRLATSIETRGIIEPLVVIPTRDGKYLIADGHQRFRAAKKKGLEKLPCVIDNSYKFKDKGFIQLGTNVLKEKFEPLEEAEGLHVLLVENFGDDYMHFLKNLVNKKRATNKEQEDMIKILKSVGLTPESAYYRRIKLLKLDDKIKEEISKAEDAMPITIASELSRIEDRDLRDRAFKHWKADRTRTTTFQKRVSKALESYNKGDVEDAYKIFDFKMRQLEEASDVGELYDEVLKMSRMVDKMAPKLEKSMRIFTGTQQRKVEGYLIKASKQLEDVARMFRVSHLK